MKRYLVILVLNVLFAHTILAQESILGTWLTEGGDTKVEIYEKGDELYGRVVWLKRNVDKKGNPPKDRKNPDKSLRDRPILGIDILQELHQVDDEKWQGKIYAPKHGRTLKVELRSENENALSLYVSAGSFTKKNSWTRANEE